MYSIQTEKFQNIFDYYSCMVLNVLGEHLIRIWTTSEMSHWYFRTLCILSRDTNFVKPHRVQYLKQLDNYYVDYYVEHIPFSIKKELWLWTVVVGRETLHKNFTEFCIYNSAATKDWTEICGNHQLLLPLWFHAFRLDSFPHLFFFFKKRKWQTIQVYLSGRNLNKRAVCNHLL